MCVCVCVCVCVMMETAEAAAGTQIREIPGSAANKNESRSQPWELAVQAANRIPGTHPGGLSCLCPITVARICNPISWPACHYVSQLSRDRVESCLSVHSNAAGGTGGQQVIHQNLFCNAPEPAVYIGQDKDYRGKWGRRQGGLGRDSTVWTTGC
uniref:Secreted protein n=1 Tax=Pipistrellus kuhlii TaxID=59472 RepID=A0A7J7WE04_PIPKU|nr:hypothetical protein mPipKuh1_008083 [Pipistrellus kuhlii]